MDAVTICKFQLKGILTLFLNPQMYHTMPIPVYLSGIPKQIVRMTGMHVLLHSPPISHICCGLAGTIYKTNITLFDSA